MSSQPPTRRSARFWLLLGSILALALCLGGAIYILISYPLWGSTAVSNPPISWRGLPTPIVTRPGWQSFSNAQKINDLAQHDGLIWAASDGGLLVWQSGEGSRGNVAKFTAEHGLAENLTTSVAVGIDGTIWIGTATSGISHFDGTRWQTFTSSDGLPGNEVRDLVVAADGTVWAATANGIARYDGRRWFSYTRSRTLLQLPSNNVTSLTLAADGTTLFAGTAEGLVQFNGRSWDSLAQVGSRAFNHVQDVTVTPDGQLWAATQGGLVQYDGSRWQLFTTVDGLASDNIHGVVAQPDGTVWLSYGQQGLGVTQFEANNSVPRATAVTASAGLPDAQIFAILPSGRDIWLGSGAGLILHLASGGWESFEAPSEIPSHQMVDLVSADGQMWLGSSAGVSRFNGSAWELMTDGLPETAVSSLTQDSDGQLWATFKNVGQAAARFDKASDRWQPLSCPVSGPASPYVRHIVQTNDGLLWLATEAGLATFDGRSQQWNLLTTADGLPGNVVQSLALGPAGLWVGTNQGLAVQQDGRWTILNAADVREMAIAPDGTVWFITADGVVRLRGGQQQTLPVPPVSQVYDVLATDAGFWLAANEGVAFFAAQQEGTGRWQRFAQGDGLPKGRVTALAAAADGTVWASSQLQSDDRPLSSALYGSYAIHHDYLSFWNGRLWQPAIRPASVGLLHPIITSIVTTADGATWLGSLGGVSRFDGQQWTNFTVLDGLPGHELYQLLAVGDVVWAVTHGGLAQFNPASQRWKSFADVGNWGHYEDVRIAADASGTLWAGSGTDLLRYDGQRWQHVPIDLPDPAVEVRDFVVTADGRLWLTAHLDTPGLTEQFLAEYDGTEWQWHAVQLPANQQIAPFSHLWLGPDGRLWASNDSSLWVFALSAGTVSQPSQYPELIRAITDLTFLADGTPVASTRFSATPLLLLAEGANPIDLPLEASRTFAITSGADNRLWVGTDQGAAQQLPDGRWQLFPLTESEMDQTVSELTVARDGRLLLGTTNGSVLQWADGQVDILAAGAANGAGFPVSALFEDGNEQLWRGSFGGSVARLAGDTWQPFPASPPNYGETVQDAAVSDKTTIWLATSNEIISVTTVGERTVCQRVAVADFPAAGGLLADLADELWLVSERIVYRGNAAGFERKGTLALPITALAPDGAVWYITQTELVRVRADQRLPMAHGLPPETITTLAIAPDGTIWLGTTDGAAIFTGGQWQWLTTANGLASNHVTHIAFADDGAIWFGTPGGVSVLRP